MRKIATYNKKESEIETERNISMSKKKIIYKDVNKLVTDGKSTINDEAEIAQRGKVTVIWGGSALRYDRRIFNEARDVINELPFAVCQSKGVAVCNPEDSFSPLTGKIIASSRAEKSGNRKLREKLVDGRKTLNALVDYINDAINELDARAAKLDAELADKTK